MRFVSLLLLQFLQTVWSVSSLHVADMTPFTHWTTSNKSKIYLFPSVCTLPSTRDLAHLGQYTIKDTEQQIESHSTESLIIKISGINK